MGQLTSTSCGEFFDKAEEPDRCRCKKIVLNAYEGLCRSGMCENEAVESAAHVLRYHHPSSKAESRAVVECWVFENSHQAVN